jgi:hypothetical protein
MGKTLMYTRHPFGIESCPTAAEAYEIAADMSGSMHCAPRGITKLWPDEPSNGEGANEEDSG